MEQVEEGRRKELSGFLLGRIERKNHRTEISGFVGDIAGSNSLVGGDIKNISCGGFMMESVPATFSAYKHTYTVVLTGGGKHYRLIAKPCWHSKSDKKRFVEIGFKIIDAPWDWLDLTLNDMPESGFQA